MAVELQPVAFDLVSRSARQVTDKIANGALVEVADAAAAGADEMVVVMGALGNAVVHAAVVEEDAADDAEVR